MSNLATLKPFKKGVSGNPAGRPIGSCSLTTLLKEHLQQIDKRGKRRYDELLIQAITKRALKGDMRAVELIFDRTEGRTTETIRHEGMLGLVQLIESLDRN